MATEQKGDNEFWVLPLPKWDRSNKQLSIKALANKQGLEHAEYAGKRVLIRVDYNVPIKNGVIKDTARIDFTMDTIKYILDPKRGQPKCLILICHLGRPGGKFKKEDFSLKLVADKLAEYLKDVAPVRFLEDCVGPSVEYEINNCEPGTVFLLENLRFHIEETGSSISADGKKIKADPEATERFGQALTRLGDVFVFEAFGAAHRPHASIVRVNLPQRVAGKLLSTELRYFAKVLGDPKRPFVGIIGGAKVTDKIPVMENLLDIVDELIIGGGMAFTFKKVLGGQIGSSLLDAEGKDMALRILEKAKEKGVVIHLPTDSVIANKFAEDAESKTVAGDIPDGWMGLDVGPESSKNISDVIGRANTVLWNGPLGVFEWDKFAGGTQAAMEAMVHATRRGATTMIGGGDTGSASRKFSVDGKLVADQVSHVSTGGGSSLVLMEGKMLPGVDMLSDVADLAPESPDVRNIWMDVRALKAETVALRMELRATRSRLEQAEKTIEKLNKQ